MIARLQYRAAERGNKLSNLYPGLARDWWPLIEDVFSSPRVETLASDHDAAQLSMSESKC